MHKNQSVAPNDTKKESHSSTAAEARLKQGIEALKVAMSNLVLASEEKETLKRILRVNTDAVERLAKKVSRTRARPEGVVSASVTLPSKTVKGKSVEKSTPKHRAQMLEEKRLAEIVETHKKSKYSNYLVRVGGSYESGNKR